MSLVFALCVLGLTCSPPQQIADRLRACSPAVELRPTLFPHSDSARYWLSGQVNLVTQGHPTFQARYSGPHSLSRQRDVQTSRVLTLYTGLRLTDRAGVLFDAEMTGGRGIGDAFGLAGYTNLDVVRNPTLGGKPYLARLMLHYVLPLSEKMVDADRGPLSMFSRVPARRLELRVGKFSLVDFFDLDAVGSDSHLQFLNWAIDNNAAYDYAADTRGYTVAAMLEYRDGPRAIRFAEALMPKVANGLNLDGDLARAHSENVEFEHQVHVGAREATVRVLAYANHANMGGYREAIDRYLAGVTTQPDVTAHAVQRRLKYGAGVNVQLAVTSGVRAYGRAGWNEGRNESFVYTEANNAVSGGLDVTGTRWRRGHDRIGVALASHGISRDHRDYLALGGVGFLLGDGGLSYGREQALEGYYTAQLWHGLFVSADVQRLWNPGYNRDRGPVIVAAGRLHVEF